MTEEEHLQFDIAMGLKKAKVAPFEECQRIAGKVLKHMKLSGWLFEKSEPPPAH